MPAPRTIVEAIFLIIFKLEPHSIGSGIRMRYISVHILAANDTQIIGLETAAWQVSVFTH